MPPGLLASRSSRCVACLVISAGVTIGPVSVAYGDVRLSAATPAHAREPLALPAHVLPAHVLSAHAFPARRPAAGAPGRPSPSPRSPGAGPSAEDPPMAGRPAGKGRPRPGRSLTPMELERSETPADEVPPEADPYAVPAFTPPPGAFPEPGRSARQRQALDGPAARQVRLVSLGSGITLVGLGLGFLAFRMRRTA